MSSHDPELAGDTASAIAFLTRMYPNDPWHLVKIRPDGKPTARSFGTETAREAKGWIDAHQGVANLYFHVNRLTPGFADGKAKKEDVVDALFLHVDIDDLGAETRLRTFTPAPTAVIFSGGGFQAFWRLREPASPEAAERVNLAIAVALKGDKCHNADRIMRVPGTINVPGRRKKARGRVPVLARVVDDLCDWESVHELASFGVGGSTVASTAIVSPDELEVRRLRPEDLPETITPATRALIEHGDDLEHPIGSNEAKYPSRSEPVFRVACELKKAGCSDHFVVSVLLEPNFRISDSVREKARPKNYALRQVLSAGRAVADGWPHVDRSGGPRPTFANTLLALARLVLNFEYDLFRHRKFVGGHALQSFQGDLSDDGCAVLRKAILDEFGFDATKEHVRDAANTLCLENPGHPVRDYLRDLVWDRLPRVASWLSRYLGAPETELNGQIGTILLVAAVRRVRDPGCKFDTIVVLEGKQGTGKSTAIRILAGAENFSDADILTLDGKGQMEALEGVWLYEVSELEGMSRADTSKVKAFVSRFVDRARPAYARYPENRPRQNVFIGTTNDDKYLRDMTGNRRFWPVRTGVIDLVALERDRDQLWAEAAALEATNISIVLPERLWTAAAAEQADRLEDDPWLEVLRKVQGERIGDVWRVSTLGLLSESLQIKPEHQQNFHGKRLAHLMRQLGWDGPKILRFGAGGAARGYERKLK